MINVLSLCDGMGTGKLAFDELGIETNYYAIEIDRHARALADFNLSVITRPCNDLLKVTARDILLDWPKFDYVIFGFTCKSLSRQSNGSDLDGSSRILFDCMNILTNVMHRNPNAKFLIENVKSMSNEMKAVISKIIGTGYHSINSSLVSGQGRERLYWINWELEQFPEDRSIIANSILENDAKELKAWSKSSRYKDKDGKVHSSPAADRERYIEERYRTDKKANTLVTGAGCKGQSTKNKVITKDDKERQLTVRECARLQTIPDGYDFSMISDSQAYNCIGNGWTLEVIKHLLKASL